MADEGADRGRLVPAGVRGRGACRRRGGVDSLIRLLILWPVAFLLALLTHELENDHFHRLASARQIAQYGELPFRDFFDPGYFLTEMSSALVQRLLGDNLLGETLLNASFVATGAVIVLLLARRASGSWWLGVAAALVTLLARPRAYDYDKVFFYPLGILVCWRWIDWRGVKPRPTLAIAATIAVAAMFRYDNGVYVAAAAGAALLAASGRDVRLLSRDALLLAAFTVVLLLPYAAFVQMTSGIASALDQVLTYAVRESRRTNLLGLPAMTPMNLLQYYSVVALPIVAAGILLIRRDALTADERARGWSLVAIAAAIDLAILRDDVSARVGGVVGPAAVLGAWIVARVAGDSRVVKTAAGALAIAGCLSVSAVLDADALRDAVDPTRLPRLIRARAESPVRLEELSAPLRGMVGYLRACTQPEDRVLVSWYMPELYFHAQRGFAAGLSVTFGAHWTEPRFQRRSVELMEQQRPPVIIQQLPADEFESLYPIVGEYIRQRYVVERETDFEEAGRRYRVLRRSDLDGCGGP